MFAYFFCDSSSDKQRTAVSILRGLLYHLVQQHPALVALLLEKYRVQKAALLASFDVLWSVLLDMGSEQGEIYCMIDALDECSPEEQEILLTQVTETFGENNLMCKQRGICLLITSRPYAEIERHLGQFKQNGLSAFPQLERDIKVLIDRKVNELSRKNRYPWAIREQVSELLMDKADGTFLWVGIACSELHHVPSKDVVKTLQKLPRTLDALYRTLLDTAKNYNPDEYDTAVRILGVVAIALRPFHVLELSEICHLHRDVDPEVRLAFTIDSINMCRLLLVVQADNTVSLLHKSLKDFLLRGEDPLLAEQSAHAELAYRCLDCIVYTFGSSQGYQTPQAQGSFLLYSAQYWTYHVHLSGPKFEVLQRFSTVFQPRSPIISAWKDFLVATCYDTLEEGGSGRGTK
ncbi:hypothetical protein BJX99DRAFT_18142 [Aspergillus californicus]